MVLLAGTFVYKRSDLLSPFPLPQFIVSAVVTWMGPYSCVLFCMCRRCVDLRLLFLVFVFCPEIRGFSGRPV